MKRLKDHRDTVNGFGWLQNGKAVATACEDRCVRIFVFGDRVDQSSILFISKTPSFNSSGPTSRQIDIQAVPVDVGFLDKDKIVVLAKGLFPYSLCHIHLVLGRLNRGNLLFYSNLEAPLKGFRWTCTKEVLSIPLNEIEIVSSSHQCSGTTSL